MGFMALGEAGGATVPEAPVELVHSVGVGVKPVYSVVASWDGSDFAPVMGVT